MLLVFFVGFAAASQWGGRIVDARGARPSVVVGCLAAAAGFALWARSLPELDFGAQWYFLMLAGAGLGLVLGPVSTDALNRAPHAAYGEVTGVTQTVRNLGASLGLAVMGSIFTSQTAVAGPGGAPEHVAHATQTIAWIMAGIMAVTFVAAYIAMPRDRVQPAPATRESPAMS